MDLTANIYTIQSLHKCVQNQEGIVIYGAGDYGKKLVDYLFFIKEEKKIKGIIVTNKRDCSIEYKGIPVQEACSFMEKNIDALVIIAASLVHHHEIVMGVAEYTRNYRCMMPEVYNDICKSIDVGESVPYRGIDFLCAGFCKCGTTSFYSILRRLKGIYLSDLKESMFFEWYNNVEEAKKILVEKHFANIKRGQLVGMIEPTFCTYADQIHEFFGDKVKIVFLVRNPVHAVFSDFKMENREGMAGLELAYQSKGAYYQEMFDEFFERIVNEERVLVWEYAYWIRQFIKRYTKQQIRIVFFEELVRNTQRELNGILQFLGAKECRCETLPLENKGDFVMADESGYSIAKLKSEWDGKNPQLSLEDVRKRRYEDQQYYMELKQKYAQAKKVYGIKMTNDQRMKVQAYFAASVRELEEVTGRDLSELWF